MTSCATWLTRQNAQNVFLVFCAFGTRDTAVVCNRILLLLISVIDVVGFLPVKTVPLIRNGFCLQQFNKEN